MTRKEVCNSMTLQDAIQVFRDTNAYGTMDLAKTVILEALEQKTAHWILTDVEGGRVWHCKCSKCGKDPQTYVGGSENWWLIKNNLPKYCPHCGAGMEAKQ